MSTTSSLEQERELTLNMKIEYDELRNRDEPEYRVLQNVLKERRTGVHSGCTSCRREGFRRADNCIAKGVIYNAYVSRCTHVPLGDFAMDVPVLPPSEDLGEMRM